MNWWHQKIKDHITKKSGIIYRFKCDRLECDEEYIGEISRTFEGRFKEHLKAPSPIHDHSNTTGHATSLENFSIVGREKQNLSRLIKESMFIRVNSPSLSKNIGKYHLLHIWDEVHYQQQRTKIQNKLTQWLSICHQGNKICLDTFQPCGYSIGHNGNNISLIKHMWLFHLAQVAITSAIRHLVITSANMDVAIPSATLSYQL